MPSCIPANVAASNEQQASRQLLPASNMNQKNQMSKTKKFTELVVVASALRLVAVQL
jgi:hypothetical protein